MIVLVIRKSDNKVMSERQDSPHHKPGQLTKIVVKQEGGSANDYMERIVPPEDTQDVMQAKELSYEPGRGLLITPYDEKEKQLRRKEPELANIEDQLIEAHMKETAARDLGMDANLYAGLKTSLEARRAALQQQIDNLKE